MDVIALVGPSGTGKSHRALLVAHKHQADAIIDDGILIKDGKIVGGHSAKKEKSRIMAVRRAIFVLPGHAEEVRAAIDRVKPHRILVLGTSENMVHKITKALHLPAIAQIIHIEDIATKAEMEKARFYRLKQGNHSRADHRAQAAFFRLSRRSPPDLFQAFPYEAAPLGREVHRAAGVQLLRQAQNR